MYFCEKCGVFQFEMSKEKIHLKFLVILTAEKEGQTVLMEDVLCGKGRKHV